MMDNIYIFSLFLWPAVVVISAILNMVISGTFSWSELIFDSVAGVVAGYFFHIGFQVDGAGVPIIEGWERFFFIVSHGLLAWSWQLSDGIREWMGDFSRIFYIMAGLRIGATIWAAAWDHLSTRIGAKFGVGQIFFSILVAPSKLLFSTVTSAVGMLIWVVGLIKAAGNGKVGFAGGTFFSEFSPSDEEEDEGGDEEEEFHATTVGFTIHTWYGNTPFEHELYHSRQYIYLSDWLIPLWLLGIIWGTISAAISKKHDVSWRYAFGADTVAEVGNPIEIAPHHM